MDCKLVLLVVAVVITLSEGSSTCCAGRSLMTEPSPGPLPGSSAGTSKNVQSLTDVPETDLARRVDVSVSMSTQLDEIAGYTFPGSRAVDNIYIPPDGPRQYQDYSSIAHTLIEPSPWIQINLGHRRCIIGVKIWNRNFANTQFRFRNARINVSEKGYGIDSNSTRCAFSAGAQPDVKFHQCSTLMCGQYVRITAVDINNWLNLYEVEVHGW